jgi:hypothetical protein
MKPNGRVFSPLKFKIFYFRTESLLIITMANPIWKIGLFTKLSKDKAECNVCKKSGLTKYIFELPHARSTGCRIHWIYGG